MLSRITVTSPTMCARAESRAVDPDGGEVELQNYIGYPVPDSIERDAD